MWYGKNDDSSDYVKRLIKEKEIKIELDKHIDDLTKMINNSFSKTKLKNLDISNELPSDVLAKLQLMYGNVILIKEEDLK